MPMVTTNVSVAPGPISGVAPGRAAATAADPSGLSAFLAILAPALAAAPADAPPTVAASEPDASALPVPTAAPEPAELVASGQSPERQVVADAGKKLPEPTELSQLLPGLVLSTAAVASAAPVGGGNGNSRLASAIGDAVRRPVPVSPGADPIAAGSATLLLDPDLDAAGAAANAYLDRFTTDPHRLPTSPVAVIGVTDSDTLAQDALSSDPVDGGDIPLSSTVSQQRTAAASSPTAAVIDAPSAGFRDSPGSAQWQRALDDQMLLMVSKGSQHARIRMHPEELGQLDIRIKVGGERVDLSFAVQHPAVAAAVNQHLSHLAQLFADQGLAMGQTSVSHQQGQSGDRPDGGNGNGQGSKTLWSGQDEEIVAVDNAWAPGRLGLFDAFA